MTHIANFLVAIFLWAPSVAISKDAKNQTSSSRISFYKAEFVCPAAPQIGCGSASKPVLLEFECHKLISEAWLSRKGTMVALVWKQNTPSRARNQVVGAILGQQKVREIKGGARAQALNSFRAGTDWYRGEAVDRLSEEEAAIMATRLVRRMQKFIPITGVKGRELQHQFSDVLARKLIKGESREQTETAIMRICQEHLDASDLAILQKANEEGAFSNLRQD